MRGVKLLSSCSNAGALSDLFLKTQDKILAKTLTYSGNLYLVVLSIFFSRCYFCYISFLFIQGNCTLKKKKKITEKIKSLKEKFASVAWMTNSSVLELVLFVSAQQQHTMRADAEKLLQKNQHKMINC